MNRHLANSDFGCKKILLACLAIACCWGCSQAPPPPPVVVAPPAPPVAPQKAVAGVGKQGQILRQHTGIAKIISGPALARFNLEQRAVLEFQIPPAIQQFKALEGRFPKSHEEFMEKIVEANRFVLPELPAGNVYRFNPELGELWVYPEDEAPQ